MRITSRCAQYTLYFLIPVILWGSFVRSSGSGAGCGRHWPLCQGEWLPLKPLLATEIEWIHRFTSALSTFLCLALSLLAWRFYPKTSFTRKAAFATSGFIALEALLGASLVLLGWVDRNQSLGRTLFLGIHLVNTFLLIAAVFLTYLWSQQESQQVLQKKTRPLLPSLCAVLGILSLGITGAMAALGDTLFPATHWLTAFQEDFSKQSHFLVHLRIIHPTLSLVFMIVCIQWLSRLKKQFPILHPMIQRFYLCLGLQMGLGVANIFFLTPIFLQTLHLLGGLLLWLALVHILNTYWTET